MALYMTHHIPSAIEAAQRKSHVTYTAPSFEIDPPSIVLLEARSLLASSGTTGFRTWEAALHLASFLFSREARHLVTSRNILELGAGTGFLSILCSAHLGAKYVLATDGSREIMNNLKDNLDLNGLRVSDKSHAEELQWGQALIGGVADCRREGRAYDLIIGADVVRRAILVATLEDARELLTRQQTYDVNSIPPLVATMRDLFELYPKAEILISATVRNEDTLGAFLKACGLYVIMCIRYMLTVGGRSKCFYDECLGRCVAEPVEADWILLSNVYTNQCVYDYKVRKSKGSFRPLTPPAWQRNAFKDKCPGIGVIFLMFCQSQIVCGSNLGPYR